jgi:chromosomal replication initiation ATPase DnaA
LPKSLSETLYDEKECRYLCHKISGQRLKDIGLHFGIGVSGVSQASRRVTLQIKDDKKLKKKIDKIM